MSTTTAPSPRPITVTQAQLRDLLTEAIKRATPVTFTALTRPEQKQTPFAPPQSIRKLVRVNAMAGCRYANAAERKGLTAQEERAWGDRDAAALVTRPLKDGTGVAYYLPVQLNHVSRPLYLVPSPTGKLAAVPAERVQPYLRPERPQPIAAYKDYSLASLITVHINGRRYRVRPDPTITTT
jgi:hypothetical protein